MRVQFYLSKIVIFSLLFTIGTGVYAETFVSLKEERPSREPLEWIYRWAIKSPEIALKNEKGELFLSGTNEAQKKNVTRQLETWMGIRSQNFNQINWANDINLTPLLNKKFSQFNLGEISPSNGINCHGTSLYISGLLKHLSHVGAEEFNFYVKNYCHRVSSPQEATLGAISFGRSENIYEHSFIVVGKNLVFEKKSIDRRDPFRFRLIKNFGPSQFYRCTNITSLCAKKYQKLKNNLDLLDQTYSQILSTGDDSNMREHAIFRIQPLIRAVEHALKFESKNDCRADLLKMKYRLISLESVAGNILGWDLYKEGAGRLLHPIRPKL